jgi:hypothetical protein
MNKWRTPPAFAPPLPPAFPAPKNLWGPLPRRGSSTGGDADDAATQTTPSPLPIHARRFVATPEPEPEPEFKPEPEGEWAESLYECKRGERRLRIVRALRSRGGMHWRLAIFCSRRTTSIVLLVERTSDEWWVCLCSFDQTRSSTDLATR